MVVMLQNEIDRQAAQWAAKADGVAANPDERAALERWLAADTRHLGAYAKAIAVLAQVERVRAAGDVPVVAGVPAAPSRRVVLAGGVAASLAALTAAAGYGWLMWQGQTYATKLGATEVVPLADGSVVTLNTDTEIAVRYTKARREVVLVKGEAFFDVAKNKARPFVVVAADVHVRAVGTSFVVQALPQRPLGVLVREGTVEVKRPAVPVAAAVLVHANMRATAPADGPIVAHVESADWIARALSWKSGRISFEDDTLEAAAREFSRYSTTRIVIADPAIARRTVTGLFVSNDPVGFAKAVAVSLNLQVEVGESEIRITRKAY